MEKLQINISNHRDSPDITLMVFKGDLDAGMVKRIEREFAKLNALGRILIIADFSRVKFISSPVVGELMGCRERLIEKGGNLILIKLSKDIRQKFELMGANQVFDVSTDEKTAISKLYWENQNKPDEVNLSFTPNLNLVPNIRTFISNIVLQKGYPHKDVFRIETIVDEICNNAIEHGENGENDEIKLKCLIDKFKIDLRVTNKTNDKNVTQLQQLIDNEDKSNPQQDSKRGRGIRLVKMLSSSLKVEISRQGTMVQITKYKEKETHPEGGLNAGTIKS